jgi:ketosteroid isomerase-like protein
MGEKENQLAVERYFEAFSNRNFESFGELFHEDAVEEWPQSGEPVRGFANMRSIAENYPGLPTVTVHNIKPAGDLVVAEADFDYSGTLYKTVVIFEFDKGKVRRETAYFAEPFEAPDWRSQWVDRI